MSVRTLLLGWMMLGHAEATTSTTTEPGWCSEDTLGSCHVFACHPSRNAVCVTSPWHMSAECKCSPGQCAYNGACETKCQKVSNAAISGHNSQHLTGKTAEECEHACNQLSWCKSFDYFKDQNACDLSNVCASDVGGLKYNYPGNPYDHYSCECQAVAPTCTGTETWNGHWYWENHDGTMDLDLTLGDDNTLTGTGDDSIGQFDLEGHARPSTIRFTKSYHGQHQVEYIGHWDDSQSMYSGVYTIAAGATWAASSGNFEMSPPPICRTKVEEATPPPTPPTCGDTETWNGHWYWQNQVGGMNLDLTLEDNHLSGLGDDSIGHFNIEGQATTSTIHFTKSYHGQHTVEYVGHWDESLSMYSGVYTIAAGPTWQASSGNFDMIPPSTCRHEIVVRTPAPTPSGVCGGEETWDGHWYWDNQVGAMNLDLMLEEPGDVLSGVGDDSEGHFNIEGQATHSTIHFTKSYHGQHTVEYVGHWDESQSMYAGVYTIAAGESSSGSWQESSGNFDMTPPQTCRSYIEEATPPPTPPTRQCEGTKPWAGHWYWQNDVGGMNLDLTLEEPADQFQWSGAWSKLSGVGDDSIGHFNIEGQATTSTIHFTKSYHGQHDVEYIGHWDDSTQMYAGVYTIAAGDTWQASSGNFDMTPPPTCRDEVEVRTPMPTPPAPDDCLGGTETWDGHWYFENQVGAMNLDLTMEEPDDHLSGTGDDSIGHFNIEGQATTSTIQFTKSYHGQHTVEYSGTWDESTYLYSGTYTIAAGDTWQASNGRFDMTPPTPCRHTITVGHATMLLSAIDDGATAPFAFPWAVVPGSMVFLLGLFVYRRRTVSSDGLTDPLVAAED